MHPFWSVPELSLDLHSIAVAQRMDSRIFIFLLLSQQLPLLVSSVAELKYALFVSDPVSSSVDSSGAVSAIEIAEEMLNRNETVLPGYSLSHTEVVDTMCNRTISLDEFFDTVLLSNQTAIGLLGCGCSVASTAVAEVLHHASISQIDYSSVASEISDRSRFRNFFNTYPPEKEFTPGIVSVLRYYGWRRIAFFTEQETLFIEAFESMERALVKFNISVVNKLVKNELKEEMIDGTEIDLFFEKNDYRVFFLNVHSDIARQIICEAFKRGYTYPRYVWFFYGWYAKRWWTEIVNPQRVDCNDTQLAGFLDRAISLQIIPMTNDPNMITDTGLTPNQFFDIHRSKVVMSDHEEQMNEYTFNFRATLAYDALWSLAFALDRADQLLKTKTKDMILKETRCSRRIVQDKMWDLVPLENFTYSNELMGCIVKWSLHKTNFVGISGPVEFDNSGSRVQSLVHIFQYRINEGDSGNKSLHLEMIAFTNSSNSSPFLFYFKDNENNSTVYPSNRGGIPPDGTPYAILRTFYLELVIIYYFLACLGLVFCTACLVFNFTQRNKKLIRLTSPVLNYFFIAGTYILYMSIFIRLAPSTDFKFNEVKCLVINSSLSVVGCSLVFGVMITKLGRIYYIFHNPTTKKKAIRDWYLVVIILLIFGVGLLIVVLQAIVPQLRISAFIRPDTEHKNGTDEYGVEIIYMTYQCHSVNDVASLGVAIAYVYLLLLQIVCIILAIQTRKVKVKGLNDTKYIVAMVFMSTIVLALLGISSATLTTLININEIIFSGVTMLTTTSFLSLVFIPKMVNLYRDPVGEKMFTKSHVSDSIVETNVKGRSISVCKNTQNPTEMDGEQSSTKIIQLQLKVTELEHLLEENQVISNPNNSQAGATSNSDGVLCTVTFMEDSPGTTGHEGTDQGSNNP